MSVPPIAREDGHGQFAELSRTETVPVRDAVDGWQEETSWPRAAKNKRGPRERAVRAGTERLISATAGSGPVPSLKFGEVFEAAPSSLTSHRPVRHAARLLRMVLDKILSTIESNY
jgi:hypothetical protein